MAEGKSCTRQGTNQFLLHRQSSCKKETLWRGENSILDLISMGTPLPAVLNGLCAAIDLQIGDVVSVILPADDQEPHTVTNAPGPFGLQVFWSASIPLRNEDVLGSLQIYCCVSRPPTQLELQLIERVTHLAALAIQRHNDEEDFERFSRDWISARRDSNEWVYLN
jgi:GAF domain-containing protein